MTADTAQMWVNRKQENITDTEHMGIMCMGITIDLLFMRNQVLNSLSDKSVITVVPKQNTDAHEFVCCQRCSGRTR